MAIMLSVFPTELGWLGIAVSRRGLSGVSLPLPTEDGAMARLQLRQPDGVPVDGNPWPELRQRLIDYAAGVPVDFYDVPLDMPERPIFWRKVWEICARIPYGETRTYAELAAEVGSPRAFRAVGGAMAANPLPIVVPCHRVVGSSGSLVGFGGGLEQKKRLLEMESAARRGVEAGNRTGTQQDGQDRKDRQDEDRR